MAIAASDRAFVGVAAGLFVSSTAATVAITADAGVAVCGGGTMAWPPPTADIASFLAMWIVMMTAMMLPSLVPLLWRCRRAIGGPGRDRLTALVGAGYFCVWTMIGVAVFPLAVFLPSLMQAAPPMVGAVFLIAGALQLTMWKARHLACWHAVPERLADADMAWRYGLRLGRHCALGSMALTAVLLAVGMMDLGAMAIVTIAVTIERLAPAAWQVTRMIGVVLFGIGVLTMAGIA